MDEQRIAANLSMLPHPPITDPAATAAYLNNEMHASRRTRAVAMVNHARRLCDFSRSAYKMMPKKTRFVSVEMVIRTNADCQDWIAWFERQDNYVTKMPSENHESFVYFAPLPSSDANQTIRRLCQEINELPENVRRQWTDAEQKEFLVGYHVGETPHCFIEHIDSDTLELVHQNGASIRIALYPAPNEDD